jgi:general stress protein 26
MPSPQELEQKFWDSIKSDMTVMLGVEDAEDGHFRPMTAIAEHETRGPLWFFTATDTAIPPVLKGGTKRAMIAYSAKGHDLFATLHGTIRQDNEREMIDRLWSPFVAAWFEGGKEDPKLGEIWLNENSLFAGIKMLLGADPKDDYKDKVATIAMR